MYMNFIIISIALAGFSILWRKLLKDIPGLKKVVSSLVGQAGTCGVCYTFWFALILLIFLNPWVNIHFEFRTYLPNEIKIFISILLNWFSLGFAAIFFRWVYLFFEDSHNLKKHIHKH